jgi:hypothetical protein
LVGDEVNCVLQLATESTSTPFATGLQLTLSYDTTELSLIGFYDNLCFDGVGCFDLPVAGQGAQPLSSGHQVSAAPPTLSAWDNDGFGALILVHLQDITTPITTAQYNGGVLVGDASFITMKFTLLEDKDGTTGPAEVSAGSLIGSDQVPSNLPMSVIDGVIVSGTP